MLTLATSVDAAKRQRTGALQDASRFSRVVVGAQRLGLRRPSAAFSRNCANVDWNCYSPNPATLIRYEVNRETKLNRSHDVPGPDYRPGPVTPKSRSSQGWILVWISIGL